MEARTFLRRGRGRAFCVAILAAAALLFAIAMTFAPTKAWAVGGTNCEGEESCAHQAAIVVEGVTTHYDTLTEALEAAKGGQTVTLLKDINNDVSADGYANGGINYSLKANTTLDGNGHTLSGHIGVYIPEAGATVNNVKFFNIHNSTEVDEATCKYYGWKSKIGNQSAIYASGLTGTATITGCTFDNIDWDAIQITPTEDASIVIKNNVFQHTNTTDTQLRYVHIQYTQSSWSDVVMKELTITDNQFYTTENLKDSFCSVGVWQVSKKTPTLQLSGNYLEDPSSTEVTVIGTEKMFPSRSNPTTDTDDYQPVAYDRSVVFDTLQDAVDQTTKYVRMMVGTEETAAIPEGKEIYFYSYGHAVGAITNNGSMQIYGSELARGSKIVNNGTMSLSGNSATVYDIVNNGTIKITSGATYDLSKIDGSGTVTITGGTFSTMPSDAQLAPWYKAVEQSGESVTYKVSSMTMAEKVEAGLVATSSKSTGNCYTSVTEGVNATDKATTYLQTNSDEDVVIRTPYSGGRSLYANKHSFTGSIVIQENCDFLNLLGDSFNLKYVSGDRLRIGFYSTAAEVTIQNADLDLLEVNASGDCTVTGGNYGSVIAHTYYDKKTDTKPKYTADLSITGGCFASSTVTRKYTNVRPEGVPASEEVPLSAFLPEGYTVVEGTGAYPYQVVKASDAAATVVPAAPSVSAPDGDEAAAALVETLKNTENLVAGSGLDVAASTKANENTLTAESEKVTSALSEAGVDVGETVTVTIVIQPYMDVNIVEVSVQDENKTLTLDITPKYNVVATTANLDGENPDNIVIADAGVEGANAAIVEAAMPLTITQPVTVTIPLPEGFAGDGETLCIEHAKSASRTYFYTGKVAKDVLTFTNPHGFSQFTISATNDAAAEIDGIGYATLQQAVDEVEDGQTVKLLANDQSATVSRAVSFKVEANGTTGLDLKAGSGYAMMVSGDTYTFAASAPAPAPTPEQFDVVVADVQNGAVELSAKTAKEGQKVTVTVTPDLGWELAQLTVADEDGDALELTENADGTYSFTMPAGDVTVHASFADAWENPFTDLSEDHWGYGAVRTANLLGLMKGIGGTTLFAPDDGLLREQAATVMWNLMGAGDVSRPEAPQADVDQSQWYAPYVNWAVDSKVMDGYSEDDFGVGDSLTREQFAAVVAKAVGADVDSADQAALGAFPDADGVSGWARATMAWAVEAGVLNGVGTEDGSRELQATRELTRAEMATMMVNAIEVGVLDFGA